MIQIKNILVPVDFSQPSKKALRFGLSLALQFHARLVVAHVIPSLALFDYGFPGGTPELEKLASADARRLLDETVSLEYRERVQFHPIVRAGDVRDELLRIITEEHIDFVVMGSHGRRNVERFFLGSTTEHILRKVPVPVLTVSRIVPGREIQTPGPVPIRRIVYAADLTDNIEIGLQYSAELARTFGAELTVVHVIDSMESGQLGIEIPGAIPFDFTAIQAIAQDRIREAVETVHAADIKPSVSVIEGTPHNTIIRFADEVNADLLVLNLQSKGVLERVMLGSTAERVIRASHIPVLSIPTGNAASFMQTTFAEKAGSIK